MPNTNATVNSAIIAQTALTTQITNLTTEHDSALEQVKALNARVAELEASQADFDAEVARVVASTGHTPPAQVTPHQG